MKPDRNYYRYSLDSGKTFSDSNIFSTLNAGTYQLLVDDTVGCAKYIQEVQLIDPDKRDSLLQASICFGDSVLFEKEYRKSAGNYAAVYTDVNGCDSQVTLNLSVDPLPKVEFTTLDVKDRNVQLSVKNLNEKERITWHMGNGVRLFDYKAIDYTYPENGTFNLCAVIEGVCGLDSQCLEVKVEDLQVDDFSIETLGVYPNRSKGVLYVSGLKSSPTQLSILGLDGKMLKSVSSGSREQVELDLSGLPKGPLLLQINNGVRLITLE